MFWPDRLIQYVLSIVMSQSVRWVTFVRMLIVISNSPIMPGAFAFDALCIACCGDSKSQIRVDDRRRGAHVVLDADQFVNFFPRRHRLTVS